jgi:hypothetical protein
MLPECTKSSLVNAPGGYAIFQHRIDNATGDTVDSLSYHNFYTGDDMAVIWSAEEDGWEVVWASPAPLGNNLTPFQTIQ